MSAAAEALPGPRCTVCGTDVEIETTRCPACGLMRPAARGRQVLGRRGLWMFGIMLLAVYSVVLIVVAGAR
jgi:predicted nucleic acid-binding Zn ribbon protein